MDINRPYTFGELVDTFGKVKANVPEFQNWDLKKFSKFMNQQTGTEAFSQGLEDNWVKRASLSFDRLLKPVSEMTGEAGAYWTKKVFPELEEQGRALGESLPRSLAEIGAVVGGAALAIPAVAGASATAPAWGIPLMAAGAASAGASGYEKTGSKAVGVVQGGLTAALPGFMSAGKKALQPLVQKAFYQPVAGGFAQKAGQGVLTGAAERAIQYTGENIGATINQELAIQGTSVALGEGVRGFDSAHMFELFAGQVPFAMIDALNVARTPRLQTGGESTGGSKNFRSWYALDEARKLTTAADDVKRDTTTFNFDRLPQSTDELVKTIESEPVKPLNVYRTGLDVLRGKTTVTTKDFLDVGLDEEVLPGLLKQYVTKGMIVEKGPGAYEIAKKPQSVKDVVTEAKALFPVKKHSAEEPKKGGEVREKETEAEGEVPISWKDELTQLLERGDKFDDALTTLRRLHTELEFLPKTPEYAEARAVWKGFSPKLAFEKQTEADVPLMKLPGVELAIKVKGKKVVGGKVQKDVVAYYEPGKGSYVSALTKFPEDYILDKGGVVDNVFVSGEPVVEGGAIIGIRRADGVVVKPTRDNRVEIEPGFDRVELDSLLNDLNIRREEDASKPRNLLQNYGAVDAIIRQYKERFGDEELINKPIEPMSIEEKVDYAHELGNRLSALVIEAATDESGLRHLMQHELDSETRLKGDIAMLLRDGHITASEALDRTYNIQMKKLSKVVDMIERMENETLGKTEKLKVVESRLAELGPMYERGELTDAHLRVLVDVTNNLGWERVRTVPIKTTGGTRMMDVPFGTTDVNGFILAAGPAFIEQKAGIVKAFRESKRNAKKIADEKWTEKQTELGALRWYAETYAITRGQKDIFGQEKVSIEAVQEVEKSLGETPEKIYKSPEEVAAEETMRDEAQLLGVRFRNAVPMTEYKKEVWNMALELAGSKPVKRNAEAVAEKLNKFLKVFYNNGFGLDLKFNDKGDLIRGADGRPVLEPVTLTGWEALGKQIGYAVGNEADGARRDFKELFKPALTGLVKLMRVESAKAERGEASLLDMKTQFPEGFKEKVVQGWTKERDRLGTEAIEFQGEPATEVGTKGAVSADSFLKEGVKGASLVGAQNFFRTYFTRLGLSTEATRSYTDIAVRVAAAFYDVSWTRIGELQSESLGGLSLKSIGGRANNLVLLKGTTGAGSQSLAVFNRLQTLGHEMWHVQLDARLNGRLDPVKSHQIDSIVKWAAEMDPEGRSASIEFLTRTLIPKELNSVWLERFVNQRAKEAYLEHHEFLADTAGMLVLGMVSPDKLTKVSRVGEQLVLTDTHLAQFARGLYVPLRDVVKAVEGYGTYFLGQKSEAVSDVIVGIEKTLSDLTLTDQAANALMAIERFEPEYYDQLLSQSVVEPVSVDALRKLGARWRPGVDFKVWAQAQAQGGKALGLVSKAEIEKAFGIEPGFIESWFSPFSQLAEKYPMLRSINDIVRGFRSMQNDLSVKALTAFVAKTNKLGKLAIDTEATGLRRLVNNPKADWAATKVALLKNEMERVMTDEEIRKAVHGTSPGFSEETVRAVIDFHRAVEETMPRMANIIVNSYKEKTNHAAASILLVKNPGMKWQDALATGQQFHAAVVMSLSPTPGEALQGAASLQQLRAAMAPPVFEAAYAVTKGMVTETQKLAQRIVGKPWFTPELRIGRYAVAWKRKNGETGMHASDSREEVVALQKKLQAEGVVSANVWDKYDRASEFSGMRSDVAEMFARVESIAFEAAEKAFGPSEDLAKFKDLYQPGATVMKEVKARSPIGKHLMKRKLAEGRELTSVSRGVIHYVLGVSEGVAKSFTRDRANLALNDAELLTNPKMQQLGREHFNNVVNAPYREWSLIKNINFAYFLGFNFSSMVIESTQPVLTMIPQFTRMSGDATVGYKMWGSALGDLIEGWRSKGVLKDVDAQKAMERARSEQVVDFGIMQEFHDEVDARALYNLRNLTEGSDKLVTAGQLAAKPLYWYLKTARTVYSTLPRLNSQVAFLAAYKMAKEHGVLEGGKLRKLEGEELYGFAKRMVGTTMFGGGAAARPVKAFSQFGKMGSLVGVMMSLQTYSLSTIAMMARFAKEAIGRSGSLTGAERTAAKKAVGQMLLTQVAMGGAMSLPFVAGAIAVIDAEFPELELQKNTRVKTAEAFTALLGDEDLGRDVGYAALKGLASAVTGADISSRISLGNVLGVNPYGGFSVANLVGPSGSIVENVAKAGTQASQGDFLGASKSLLPIPYKNMIQMWKDDFAARDAGGKLLFDPSGYEKSLLSVGVTPRRLAESREARRLVSESEQVQAARLRKFHDELALLLLRGEVAAVREKLVQQQQEVEGYSAREGARSVVTRAQSLVEPVDLARSGGQTNATNRQGIVVALGQSQEPRETKRLLQKLSLEAQLGISGGGQLHPLEWYRAMMIDQLMKNNPRMPKQVAETLVEQSMRRSPQAVL